jgi:hypothetical protein
VRVVLTCVKIIYTTEAQMDDKCHWKDPSCTGTFQQLEVQLKRVIGKHTTKYDQMENTRQNMIKTRQT